MHLKYKVMFHDQNGQHSYVNLVMCLMVSRSGPNSSGVSDFLSTTGAAILKCNHQLFSCTHIIRNDTQCYKVVFKFGISCFPSVLNFHASKD
jgi:hypothetical protein